MPKLQFIILLNDTGTYEATVAFSVTIIFATDLNRKNLQRKRLHI